MSNPHGVSLTAATGKPVKSKSGIRGVTYYENSKKKNWRSKFMNKWIDYHETAEEAEQHVLLAELEYVRRREGVIISRLKELAKDD
ncbi:MAG: hypothetical protein JKY52_08445 [Flavobacteriales bacterium]|nr:hypothetical protein [Flavobacteriales bacterium]